MRTSSQLGKHEQCPKHPHINISQLSDDMIKKMAQKDVVLRIMQGEPISLKDIPNEINGYILGHGVQWENNEQQRLSLAIWTAEITRYISYASQRREGTYHFPYEYDDDMTIDFYGEQIKAKCDYFLENGNTIIVGRIKTSPYYNEASDLEEYETYALGRLGEKLFPGKKIIVEYDHLGDNPKNSKLDMQWRQPYESNRMQKISKIEFNERTKNFFNEKRQEEIAHPHICTSEECSGCSNYNVCNYVEANLSEPIDEIVENSVDHAPSMEQQRIIDVTTGLSRVNAGPGAGKTFTLGKRIAKLIQDGNDPREILVLTFTRAGADEMTARANKYCASAGLLFDPSNLTSTTFHSFCLQLIKAYYQDFGYTKPPVPIPDERRSGIINDIFDMRPHISGWSYTKSDKKKTEKRKNEYEANNNAVKMAIKVFDDIRKNNYTRNTFIDNGNGMFLANKEYTQKEIDIIFDMYEDYQYACKRFNFIEQDDIIGYMDKLEEIHPTIWEDLGYKHIMVDEFQDTDLKQINLLNRIINNTHFQSFMAIGDDSQSIFAFRDTSPEFFLHFENYFGRIDNDLTLVENHRSNKATIDLANKINDLAQVKLDKELIATKEVGIIPKIHGCYSAKQEYKWIAEQVKAKIDLWNIENAEYPDRPKKYPKDIAVIMSTGLELRAVASELTKLGVPSVQMSPTPFIENSRVCALCTFYKSFVSGSTQGFIDFQNVLTHGGLKNSNAEELERIATQIGNEVRNSEHSARKFLEYANLLDEEHRDECYQKFLEKIANCTDINELDDFFRDFDLYGQNSKCPKEGRYAGVCLTTIHSSKGLEWDTTFLSLSGLDSAYNHSLSARVNNMSEEDEIIRKWFVGATRAKNELIMSGEYVVNNVKNANSTTLTNNTYVYKAYQLLGKVWDFNRNDYASVRNTEKNEDITRRTTGIGQNSGLLNNTLRNGTRIAIGQHQNLNINPIYTTRQNYLNQQQRQTQEQHYEDMSSAFSNNEHLGAEEFDV